MAFNQMIVVPEVCIGNSCADTINLSGISGALDFLVAFSGGDKVIFQR